MSVFYAPETAMAKELRKWEYGNPGDGYRGYRELVTTEYPKVLYLYAQTDDGIQKVDSRVAESAQQEANLVSRGFFVDQVKAIAAVEQSNLEIAKLAAERHYHERHMSEPAKREVQALEDETDAHIAAIPVTPIKRHRRTKKEMADAGHQ
jgi:hypothetical protein